MTVDAVSVELGLHADKQMHPDHVQAIEKLTEFARHADSSAEKTTYTCRSCHREVVEQSLYVWCWCEGRAVMLRWRSSLAHRLQCSPSRLHPIDIVRKAVAELDCISIDDGGAMVWTKPTSASPILDYRWLHEIKPNVPEGDLFKCGNTLMNNNCMTWFREHCSGIPLQFLLKLRLNYVKTTI